MTLHRQLLNIIMALHLRKKYNHVLLNSQEIVYTTQSYPDISILFLVTLLSSHITLIEKLKIRDRQNNLI